MQHSSKKKKFIWLYRVLVADWRVLFLLATPHGTQNFPTRDQTCSPSLQWKQSLNHWTTFRCGIWDLFPQINRLDLKSPRAESSVPIIRLPRGPNAQSAFNHRVSCPSPGLVCLWAADCVLSFRRKQATSLKLQGPVCPHSGTISCWQSGKLSEC